MRFDEVELETVAVDPGPLGGTNPPAGEISEAPRLRRLFALLTDLSLFAALILGLSPLLPEPKEWSSNAALAGFVIVVSFYYFVGSWLLWGKTIGGAIFDVRVVSPDHPAMPFRCAALRWIALYASLLTAGIAFLLALLPSHRSLADRLSSTRCVAGV